MAGNSGPNIVENGCVFAIDGANKKSSFQSDTRAADFVTTNQEYLSSASSELNPNNESFTIGGWFYHISGGAGNVNYFGNQLASKGYFLQRYSTGVRFYIDGLGNYATVTPLTSDAWHFIVCTYDHENSLIKISANGGTYQTTIHSGVTSSTSDLLIGTYPTYLAGYLTGQIDNLFYYSKSISQAEVTALYNLGNGISYTQLTSAQKTDLVSWWGLNEQTGLRYDSHGTNHLTDNNTVGFTTGKVNQLSSFYQVKDLNTNTYGLTQNGVALTNGVWDFDGTDDYIDFGQIINPYQKDITVSYWSNADTYTGGCPFGITTNNVFPSNGAIWTNHNTTKISVGINANGVLGFEANHNWGVGEWHMVTITVSKDLNDARLYLDGVLGDTLNSYSMGNHTNATVTMGGLATIIKFNGKVSHSTIYNRLLTAQEVLTNYNTTKHRFGKK